MEQERLRKIVGWTYGLLAACAMTLVIFNQLYVAAAETFEVEVSRYEYIVDETIKVVDGDTIDLRVDLGFNIDKTDRFRLYGIDAWETRGEERPKGLLATQFLIDQLKAQKEAGGVFIIRTRRTSSKDPSDDQGKYGRYLAELIFKFPDGKEVNLNQLLVQEGHAEKATY